MDFSIHGYRIHTIISLGVLVVAIIHALQALIFYTTSEYGVTSRRIVMKIGWIRRHSIEIFLEKVEALMVDQSMLGRLLGYGSITIVGTGGTQDPFKFVPNPLTFRDRAKQQVDVVEKDLRGPEV